MDSSLFISIRSQALTRLQANYPLPINKPRTEELHQSLRESSTRPYVAAVILYLPNLASESGLGHALSHESPLVSLLEEARLCTATLVSTASETLASPPTDGRNSFTLFQVETSTSKT
jgi:hypothetical protein